jgi:glycine cleavage system transcriptional repressor
MANYLVISALGEDRPGLVDELSQAIYQCGCNIVDSRMAVLGGEFAIILLLRGHWNQIAKIEQAIPSLEQRLQMTMISKRTTERRTEKNLLPYAVEVVSMDHPGIVHNLANFFSARGINIEELGTNSYAAAHTGTPMFSVNMVIEVPSDTHIAALRDEFTEFCDSLNLDAVMEPIKG